jgi:hypothetical protein
MSQSTSTATKPSATASVETDASTDVAEVESFFEKNPKATAIGAAIAGALLMFAAIHFI